MRSLLRVDAVARSPDFPTELRDAVPVPSLPESEQNALHNVTSALYNKESVKQATEQAISAVCRALDVCVPDKSKRARKNKRAGAEDQPSDRMPSESVSIKLTTADGEVPSDQESVFEGFETDVDEPGTVIGNPDSEAEAAEQTSLSKYDRLLGSSSDDECDGLDERLEILKGTEVANLDDISLSGSPSEEDSGAHSDSVSSPLTKPSKGNAKQAVTAGKAGFVRDSTFLPSLMGGYISGSESASDIEDARPRKRRGQRARQAIWEKKYGASARHLQKERQAGGRDAGWDMRRGAVDGNDRDWRTPWKKGVFNPLARSGNQGASKRAPTPTKGDDQGPLHPSWAAKKKAQDAQRNASFSGYKIVFE